MEQKDGTTEYIAALAHQSHEALLHSLFEQSPDAMLMMKSDGTVMLVNRQSVALFGYDREELIGMPIERLMPTRFRARHIDHRNAFMADARLRKMGANMNLFAERKDRTVFPVDIMLSPFDLNGDTMVLATIRDMKERHEAQEELQRAHDELEQRVSERTVALTKANETLQSEIAERKHAEEDRDRFFDLSLDMLCIAGFDGYFKRLNPAWSATLGFTDEELMARPFIEFVHPDDREQTIAEARKLAEVGADTIAFENRYLCKDGTYKWLSWNSTAYQEQHHLYAIARDITMYRQAQDALHESEARYSDLFENATDMIQSVDTDGRLLFANRAWLKTFGYTEEELSSLTMSDIIHPDQKIHCMDIFKRVMSGENIERVETIFVTKTGRPIDVEGDINCKFEDGQPVSTRGIFRDITERKEVERLKSEFISTVSHELRTPLTSIHGSLGLLAGGVVGELPGQAKTLIDIAYNNSDRLIRLINDILDMEKIESGKIAFEFKILELIPLIEQTLETTRAYADRFGVRLTLTHDIPDARVHADGDRLIQVLTNLVSNAAKFSPENDDVEISVTRHDKRLCIAVSDHGPGMSEEFQKHVFQKFAQEDSSTTRQKGGTGLGLSISRAIVEQLKGRIWFDTTPGEGATFYVELPEYRQVKPQLPSEKVVNGRILICEDNRDIAMLLKLLLEQAGFQVDIAYDAAQAKDLSTRHGYDAMTLDLMLPDKDGLSLLHELRNQAATRHLPVIVVSASAQASRQELKNGDAVWVLDWIDKPIDETQLLEAVNLAVSQRDYDRPRILHVENDEDLHYVVMTLLYDIADLTLARTLTDAREKLEHETFDLILLDLGLPDGSGLELLSNLRQNAAHPTPVIVFSAQDSLQNIAHDITAALVKSRTSSEELVNTIMGVIQNQRTGRQDEAEKT